MLKDTGSIYLHCDPTASHYLKLVMDAIYGTRNFRNEIISYCTVWRRDICSCEMTMKRKLRQYLPYTFPYLVLAIGFGWVTAVFVLMPGADWETHSFYLMPFPMTLMFPIALSLASMLDTNGKIDFHFRSQLEIWCIFAGTLAASYASSLLPESILEATILTMILSVVLWLAMVQATRRKTYQDLTRGKIAKKLGVSEDAPDVKRLANNQDLPQAIVAGTLVTLQVWLLTSSAEFVDWLPIVFGTPQTFSPGAARTVAFFSGWLIGMMYYRYCPNQTEIRELASEFNKHRKRE